MTRYFAIIPLIAIAALAFAADDSIIYIRATEENTTEEHAEIDRQVRTVLSPRFTIVDIRDDRNYAKPKAIAGRLPQTALSESGEQVNGYVLVAYVITTNGRVAASQVLKTTDQRLNNVALKAMNEWRFSPATLNDVAIQTAAAQEFNFKIEVAPTELVTQVLEPTGGTLLRPKEWFYSEGHRGRAYVWTLSREDSTGNRPYKTGVRIQTFVGVEDGTGKTAKQFILDFVASKKKEATRVFTICDEKDAGLFTRICLETEEGGDHILYSLFWGRNDLDVAVVSIAGTTKELWETYAPTFNKMGDIELIDMQRIGK